MAGQLAEQNCFYATFSNLEEATSNENSRLSFTYHSHSLSSMQAELAAESWEFALCDAYISHMPFQTAAFSIPFASTERDPWALLELPPLSVGSASEFFQLLLNYFPPGFIAHQEVKFAQSQRDRISLHVGLPKGHTFILPTKLASQFGVFKARSTGFLKLSHEDNIIEFQVEQCQPNLKDIAVSWGGQVAGNSDLHHSVAVVDCRSTHVSFSPQRLDFHKLSAQNLQLLRVEFREHNSGELVKAPIVEPPVHFSLKFKFRRVVA